MPKLKFFVVSAVAAMSVSLVAACATAPVDRARLATVHNIYFEGIGEPPSPVYLKGIEDRPVTPLARAHVAEDARNAIAAILIREGYQFVQDAKSADAILSINIETAGYDADKPFHQDCKPGMLIAVKLKDAAGSAILQREYFYADVPSVPQVSGWLLLRADPKYTSPDCSGYSLELVTSAFHDVVPLLAQALGAELAKQ